MHRLHRLLLLWTMAHILHLPFPVYDGDTRTSDDVVGEELTICQDLLDIDLILLGCHPPDDTDDGPVDDDPANGSRSPFALLYHSTVQGPLQKAFLKHFRGTSLGDVLTLCSATSTSPMNMPSSILTDGSCFDFTFAERCCAGRAVQRC